MAPLRASSSSQGMNWRRGMCLFQGVFAIVVVGWLCFVSFIDSTSHHDHAEGRNLVASSERLASTTSDSRRRLQQDSGIETSKHLEHDKTSRDRKLALEQFAVSNFTVLGPSSFPKPSWKAGHDAIPYTRPTFGSHRPDQDAILVFAAEYGLNTYLSFVYSLRDTGFAGDIVFCVSKIDLRQRSVKDFLMNSPNVVVYAFEFRCFNAENESVESAKGGMRVCLLDHLYADSNNSPLPDPRVPRTMATIRYELYWLWTLNYNKFSWIMLIDARDAFFQTNPFQTLPRETHSLDRRGGLLHFFGENMDATRIGKSPKNTKWLTNSYGDTVIEALKDKPTICSGSTMGEQVALEEYLRAMVSESDDTGTVLMGADQGFHNYLYYSNKLANAQAIRSISVFDQGYGAINNLGAMRTRELGEWGNGKILSLPGNHESMTVLNWDGTVSPVVHQFDRHKILSTYIYKTLTNQYQTRWKNDKRK